MVAGLDPVEALVLFGADLGLTDLRERRGWSEEEWAAGERRLAERGLLGDGALTARGRALRAEVESRTDELADASWRAVGGARAERLARLAAPLVSAVVAGGAFLDGNPMGLRPLVTTT